MLQRFSSVFEVPSAKQLVLFGFLGRLTTGMRLLAVLLFVEAESGSYALAGSVMAAMTIAQAVAAPALGRATDRFGPGRVLTLTGCAHGAAGAGFVMAGLNTSSAVLLLALGVLAGLSITPVGALVRSQWAAHLSARPGLLRSAYSVESSLDEIIFIGGPVAAVGLAHAVSPAAGVITAFSLGALGVLALAAARVVIIEVGHMLGHSCCGSRSANHSIRVYSPTAYRRSWLNPLKQYAPDLQQHPGCRARRGVPHPWSSPRNETAPSPLDRRREQ